MKAGRSGQGYIDFGQVPEQILLFLVAVRHHHAAHPRADAVAVGARRARGAQLAGRGRGVGRARQPHPGADLRLLGRHRRLRGHVPRPVQLQIGPGTAPTYAGLFWLALAVTFGIRRPGGALLAGFAFAAGTAVFHWIAEDLLPAGDGVTARAHVARTSSRSSRASAPSSSRRSPTASCRSSVSRSWRSGARRTAWRRSPPPRPSPTTATVPEHEQVHVARRRPRRPAITVAEPGARGGRRSRCRASSPATATPRCCTASTCGSTPARSPRCSAPTAPASRPCAGWRRAWSSRRSAGSGSRARTSPTGTRTGGRAPAMLLVPEARGIFPGLTVEENLTVLLRDPELRDKAYERFPILVGAAQAGGRAALGRRAADAEPGAGARRPAQGAHRRRAHARPRAARRRRR